MNPLSEKSIAELKEALRTDIGEERVKLLSDADLQQLGMFLLVLQAEAIKRRMQKIKPASTPEIP